MVGYVSDKSNSRLEKYSIPWLDENFETVGVTISLNKYVKNKVELKILKHHNVLSKQEHKVSTAFWVWWSLH